MFIRCTFPYYEVEGAQHRRRDSQICTLSREESSQEQSTHISKTLSNGTLPIYSGESRYSSGTLPVQKGGGEQRQNDLLPHLQTNDSPAVNPVQTTEEPIQKQSLDHTQRKKVKTARKLALSKCQRCRLDKVKCLPVERIWPQKCDRCVAKDLPCSESRRKERRSKHDVVSQPAIGIPLQPPPAVRVEHLSKAELGILWIYYKQYSKAYEDLRHFETELLRPFSKLTREAYNRAHSQRHKELVFPSQMSKLEIEDFLCLLATILDEHSEDTPKIARSMRFYTEGLQSSCSLCNSPWTTPCSLDGADLFELMYATCERLELHLTCCDIDKNIERTREAFDFLVRCESEVRESLWEMSCSHPIISLLLRKTNKLELFYHPTFSGWLLGRGSEQYDCLGRSTIHQWLDTCKSKPDETEIETLKRLVQICNINTQDILGRTPLHIACMRGWAEVGNILIDRWANVSLPTIFGHRTADYVGRNTFEELNIKRRIHESPIMARRMYFGA